MRKVILRIGAPAGLHRRFGGAMATFRVGKAPNHIGELGAL